MTALEHEFMTGKKKSSLKVSSPSTVTVIVIVYLSYAGSSVQSYFNWGATLVNTPGGGWTTTSEVAVGIAGEIENAYVTKSTALFTYIGDRFVTKLYWVPTSKLGRF